MTDTNNQTAASKKPSHTAYDVQDREGGESIWRPIGTAWAHKDANGFNVQLDEGRRIVLRVPTKKNRVLAKEKSA
jgi:hypothetical protein